MNEWKVILALFLCSIGEPTCFTLFQHHRNEMSHRINIRGINRVEREFIFYGAVDVDPIAIDPNALRQSSSKLMGYETERERIPWPGTLQKRIIKLPH